jgi:hypothetical protein
LWPKEDPAAAAEWGALAEPAVSLTRAEAAGLVWAPRAGLELRRVQPEYLRAAWLEDQAPAPQARREVPPEAGAVVPATIRTEAGAGLEAPLRPNLVLLVDLALAALAVLVVEAALVVAIPPKRADLVVMAAVAAEPGPGPAAREDLAVVAAVALPAERLALAVALVAAVIKAAAAAPDWEALSMSGRVPP